MRVLVLVLVLMLMLMVFMAMRVFSFMQAIGLDENLRELVRAYAENLPEVDLRMPVLYDIRWTKPRALVERRLRLEVREKMRPDGSVDWSRAKCSSRSERHSRGTTGTILFARRWSEARRGL